MPREQTLYEVLGVVKTATAAEIRRAYLKLAVKLHPDKNQDDTEGAKQQFQKLVRAYGILSDTEKRTTYDQTGSIEDSEELHSGSFEELYQVYRARYAKITEEDIERFAQEFRHSPEEREDVLRYYSEHNGDMGLLFQCVMLSDPSEDSHRYMDMINEAIANAEVERYDQYSTWAKRMAKRRRPQPKETKRKSKDNDQKQEKKSKASKADAEAELAALILQRQKARGEDSLEQAMAAKYGVDLSDMPNEEEFEAARARLVRSKAERKESSRAKKPKT